MKTLSQFMKCEGCSIEISECYQAQQEGLLSGLEFDRAEKHLSFFVINPETGKFIVPIYSKKSVIIIKSIKGG